MAYYKKIWDNKEEKEIEKNKSLVMLDLELEDLKELSKRDRMVEKYMKELEKINEDPEFREYMSAEEDARKIHNTYVKKGIEQGIEQGIHQGILITAKNMINNGMSLEEISKVTNLSIEELQGL